MPAHSVCSNYYTSDSQLYELGAATVYLLDSQLRYWDLITLLHWCMEKHRDFPAGNFNGDHFRGHRLERPLPFTLFSMEIVIMRFRHIYGGNHPEAWELTCREQDAIALQLFGATRLPP